MTRINFGEIKGKKWVKKVNWNRAVLWKVKMISFNLSDVGKIRDSDIKYIEFRDRVKNRVYRATKNMVMKNWVKKQYHQEPQYYCPIEIFKMEEK